MDVTVDLDFGEPSEERVRCTRAWTELKGQPRMFVH